MRRGDRLHDLMDLLRDGRVHRAEDLARRTGVAPRTIYRDIDALRASGLPVEGTRGAGYRVTAPVTLPPLNLTLVELEALELGMAVVAEAADPELQAAARTVAAKIDAARAGDRRAAPPGRALAIHPFADAARGFRHMPLLRAAIRARQKIDLSFRGRDGAASHRVVRPLDLDYRGRAWTLTAWCEQSRDFEVIRLDRILSVAARPELFVDEPGKSLADFLDREAAGRA